MNPANAALLDRLSLSRPGYRLLELEEVAIPIFSVRADVLLIERRAVGPLEEFVLKAIDLGFVTPTEIAGILGLEPQLVVDTLVGLQRDDSIHHVMMGNQREIRLTTQGTSVLESQLRESPAKENIRIGFDRITWAVTTEAQGHLMRPRELSESGRWELRPRLKRRVRAEELDVDQIQRKVQAIRARGGKPTVLGVERIVRADKLFLPAQLAVFESLDGADPQVAVLVDGRSSEEHESALERQGGLEWIGGRLEEASPDPVVALYNDYGPDVAKELIQHAPTSAERERARRERVDAFEAVSVEDGTPESAVVSKPVLTTSAVEFIDTYEHRTYLSDALENARRRMVIVSPWIAASVVNTGFLEQLSQLLRRGVRVHIGYGLDQRPGDRAVSKADEKAESALVQMSKRFENFTLAKLGNTHSKQLLFDDVHISGSFNWLSFQGSRNKQYRHEESTVVRIKSKVDAKYEDLCERIEAPARRVSPD